MARRVTVADCAALTASIVTSPAGDPTAAISVHAEPSCRSPDSVRVDTVNPASVRSCWTRPVLFGPALEVCVDRLARPPQELARAAVPTDDLDHGAGEPVREGLQVRPVAE